MTDLTSSSEEVSVSPSLPLHTLTLSLLLGLADSCATHRPEGPASARSVRVGGGGEGEGDAGWGRRISAGAIDAFLVVFGVSGIKGGEGEETCTQSLFSSCSGSSPGENRRRGIRSLPPAGRVGSARIGNPVSASWNPLSSGGGGAASRAAGAGAGATAGGMGRWRSAPGAKTTDFSGSNRSRHIIGLSRIDFLYLGSGGLRGGGWSPSDMVSAGGPLLGAGVRGLRRRVGSEGG